MKRHAHGFTIIEVLVAILVLGIFLTLLSVTLTGSMRMNRESQRQLNTASDAQRIIEDVKAAWSTQSNYDAACAPGISVPPGYTVQFVNLSTRAEPVTQANVKANPVTLAPVNTLKTTSPCASSTNALLGTTPASAPAMRRIVVQTGKQEGTGTTATQVVGSQDTRLTLDVLRPQ